MFTNFSGMYRRVRATPSATARPIASRGHKERYCSLAGLAMYCLRVGSCGLRLRHRHVPRTVARAPALGPRAEGRGLSLGARQRPLLAEGGAPAIKGADGTDERRMGERFETISSNSNALQSTQSNSSLNSKDYLNHRCITIKY